ncbi:MAG: serine/threonine-protein phosphatase [Acidobacteriaceae bacterium]|nr:serine/threonine-protein phosphatase [Acidobacteriaceae bacterium]
MNTATAWRAAVATDPGLERAVNEDRVWADEARGVFLVVDGLGGHAAGETAAEIALHTIEERMAALDSNTGLESQVRQAIADANTRIFEYAEQNPEYRGMACVLTLAVAQEDHVTVGHVGDSRLYLAWNGNLRKITSDHSPVGEQEDHGELTETEAMRHPRRNEVFRDVGSQAHTPDDPQFIEIKSFLFRPDAALLLCSDGLSDVLTSGEISAIVEQYEGDPQPVAQQLVDAANRAGGRDNISVVFVAGPDFLGSESEAAIDSPPRHAITRMRRGPHQWRRALRDVLWLLIGLVLGVVLCIAVELLLPRFLH